MKERKEIIIPVPLYKFKVYVWICTPETALKRFKTTWYHEQGYKPTGFRLGGGKLLHADGIDSVVWVDSQKDRESLIAGLAHEFLHEIIFTMADRGAKVDTENHEFYTYMLEYLMVQVLKSLRI